MIECPPQLAASELKSEGREEVYLTVDFSCALENELPPFRTFVLVRSNMVFFVVAFAALSAEKLKEPQCVSE